MGRVKSGTRLRQFRGGEQIGMMPASDFRILKNWRFWAVAAVGPLLYRGRMWADASPRARLALFFWTLVIYATLVFLIARFLPKAFAAIEKRFGKARETDEVP